MLGVCLRVEVKRVIGWISDNYLYPNAFLRKLPSIVVLDLIGPSS